MPLLSAPGWAWLLRHELRLEWRSFGGGRTWILLGLGGLLYALGHVAAWAVLSYSGPEAWLAGSAPGLILLELAVGLLVLASAFGLATRTLIFRGDLDLLLSAPVRPATVFAVRAIFVGLGCVALVTLLVSPVVNAGVAHGRWRLLLAYPVLASFGLACAAIAFSTTLALARRFGARRARIMAQVLGAFIGAGLMIALQVPNAMPRAQQQRFYLWFRDASHGLLGPQSPLAWPLRALFGEPIFALAAIACGVLVFCAMLPVNWRAFLDAVQRSADAAVRERPGRARERGTREFHAGLARIVIAKELKLLLRDPMLVGSTLLQLLYLVPLVIVVWSRGHAATVQLLGPAAVLLLGNLCGTLAWICVSAEEAPDLVGAAPVERWRVNLYKACAAALGPAVIALPFVGWYALRSPVDALPVAAFLAAALLSSAVIQLWSGKPARARDLALRRKDNVGASLIEMLVALGWSGACYFALARSAAAWGLVILAAVGLAIAYAARVRPD
jgi:ABC-2 type transport system permease protein